jgi:ABC-type antimicrobial peptide transport system permease subunit
MECSVQHESKTMKSEVMLHVALRQIRNTPSRTFLAIFGIAMGCGIFTIISALGLSGRDLVLKEIVHELPLDMIEVTPKNIDLGILKFNAGTLLGQSGFGEKEVKRLESLPAVTKVYPKLEIPLPMGAQGGQQLFGRKLYTDLFMTGMDARLLGITPEHMNGLPQNVVPVVVSNTLIDMYNSAIAPSLNLPQLTSKSLNGFQFDIRLGRSLMLGQDGKTKVGKKRAQIVGASSYAVKLGVSVPIETGREILAEFAPEKGERYTSILVQANHPKAVPGLAKQIQSLGFSIDKTAQHTSQILNMATGFASLTGLLILLLAGLNIAHSFFTHLEERRQELAIMHAMGMRRFTVIASICLQAALLGTFGSLGGIFGAYLTSFLLEGGVAYFLPQMQESLGAFITFPAWLHGSVLLLGLSTAVLGAFWPAYRITRTNPTRFLG